MSEIHPTAIVHPEAKIGEGTRVGAYSIIEQGVSVGRNCEIQDHVVIRGWTELGDNVRVFPFAVIGAEPQHLKYAGEETRVIIGNRVTLREAVTVHRGTVFGNKKTTIGDDTFIMAYCHVAHDCIVGQGVVMANGCQLAGHSEVQDGVVMSGLSGVGQFCRVGRYCFLGAYSAARKDVPPFITGKGPGFEVQGINMVGLTRKGFSETTVNNIRTMYKIFYCRHLTVAQAVDAIRTELGETDEVKLFVDFVQKSKMGIIR